MFVVIVAIVHYFNLKELRNVMANSAPWKRLRSKAWESGLWWSSRLRSSPRSGRALFRGFTSSAQRPLSFPFQNRYNLRQTKLILFVFEIQFLELKKRPTWRNGANMPRLRSSCPGTCRSPGSGLRTIARS